MDMINQIGILSLKVITETGLTGVLVFSLLMVGNFIKFIVYPLGYPFTEYQGNISYMIWGYGDVLQVTNMFGKMLNVYQNNTITWLVDHRLFSYDIGTSLNCFVLYAIDFYIKDKMVLLYMSNLIK